MTMKMPGIKMLNGSMSAIEARYLTSQGKHIHVKVVIVRNPYEPDCMEIHIRDSVIHNFKAALDYLRRISESEFMNVPRNIDMEVLP